MTKPKTPVANDEESAGIEGVAKGTFWVQVLFTGVGVVPFQALNADCLSDVLLLLHRDDPNDQFFDAMSEIGQQTRVYQRGVAFVTERTASVPGAKIIRATGPVRHPLDS